MIEIEGHLLSEEIFEKRFVCDLNACKGACCVEGSSGAPLEQEEIDLLDEVWDEVKPYLPAPAIKSIEEQGQFVVDFDGEYVTPLHDGKECAYTVFDLDGTAKCGIEQAYNDGKISWQKPISCHLYPIRIIKSKVGLMMNYHKWPICAPACDLGEQLDVKVFRFLKIPIIRKFGADFYQHMEAVDELLEKQRSKGS